MGYVVRTYKCEDCGLETDEMQDREDFTAPDCPACEAQKAMSGPIPSTTAIGERRASKSADNLYRVIEEGSEIRAETLGDKSLKITDMPDGFYGGGLKPGDSTAPKIQNDVTKFVDATQFKHWAAGGNSGSTVTPEIAAAVAKQSRGGDRVGSGMRTLNSITGGGPMQFPKRTVDRSAAR